MSNPTVQTELNRGDANNMADLLKKVSFGSVLALLGDQAAIEETVTVGTHVGTLANKALVILAVAATTGDTTGGCLPVPASVSPATKQVKIGTDKQTLTFYATDAVTEAKVLYVPAPAIAAILAAAP